MQAPKVGTCSMCDRPLPKGRRSYCSDKCGNRSKWVSQYGLSVEDYRTLLGDGTCPICGRKMRKVNVDHDHKTMIVRGLTCGTCNRRVLTHVGDVDKAARLVRYLTETPASVMLDGPRMVGKVILERDGRKKRRYY